MEWSVDWVSELVRGYVGRKLSLEFWLDPESCCVLAWVKGGEGSEQASYGTAASRSKSAETPCLDFVRKAVEKQYRTRTVMTKRVSPSTITGIDVAHES